MSRARIPLLIGCTGALVLSFSAVAFSQPPSPTPPFEQPSEGFPFAYFGAAEDAADPDQPEASDNDVAHFDTTGEEPVGMFRKLGQPGSQAGETVFGLDNQLGFKYFFVDRTCGGGSPRIQLAIDLDGDGDSEGNLHGHVSPPWAGCEMEEWVYENLTDDQLRWEVGAGLPGSRPFPFFTWDEIETAFGTASVLEGSLVEDAHAFSAPNRGDAFYDLVSIGNRTFEDHNDSAQRGEGNAP
jgi:hypothetical protein